MRVITRMKEKKEKKEDYIECFVIAIHLCLFFQSDVGVKIVIYLFRPKDNRNNIILNKKKTSDSYQESF